MWWWLLILFSFNASAVTERLHNPDACGRTIVFEGLRHEQMRLSAGRPHSTYPGLGLVASWDPKTKKNTVIDYSAGRANTWDRRHFRSVPIAALEEIEGFREVVLGLQIEGYILVWYEDGQLDLMYLTKGALRAKKLTLIPARKDKIKIGADASLTWGPGESPYLVASHPSIGTKIFRFNTNNGSGFNPLHHMSLDSASVPPYFLDDHRVIVFGEGDVRLWDLKERLSLAKVDLEGGGDIDKASYQEGVLAVQQGSKVHLFHSSDLHEYKQFTLDEGETLIGILDNFVYTLHIIEAGNSILRRSVETENLFASQPDVISLPDQTFPKEACLRPYDPFVGKGKREDLILTYNDRIDVLSLDGANPGTRLHSFPLPLEEGEPGQFLSAVFDRHLGIYSLLEKEEGGLHFEYLRWRR